MASSFVPSTYGVVTYVLMLLSTKDISTYSIVNILRTSIPYRIRDTCV